MCEIYFDINLDCKDKNTEDKITEKDIELIILKWDGHVDKAAKEILKLIADRDRLADMREFYANGGQEDQRFDGCQ